MQLENGVCFVVSVGPSVNMEKFVSCCWFFVNEIC